MWEFLAQTSILLRQNCHCVVHVRVLTFSACIQTASSSSYYTKTFITPSAKDADINNAEVLVSRQWMVSHTQTGDPVHWQCKPLPVIFLSGLNNMAPKKSTKPPASKFHVFWSYFMDFTILNMSYFQFSEIV